jgi:endonuclease G
MHKPGHGEPKEAEWFQVNTSDSVSIGSDEEFSIMKSKKPHHSYKVENESGASASAIGKGYDESFLGKNWNVPLPQVTGPAKDSLLQLKDGSTVRNYTHFSIAMHKDRKMAMFTAHNVDGKSINYEVKRVDWELDPVVGESNQWGNELYGNNDLDKGHLVRRRDVIWGPDKEARKANQDTFYYTNASPQHKNLNQKIWLNLENWLLQKADENEKKLAVFTGPVLRDDDKEYRGAKIPADFWKIIVLERESDHQMAAAAFMMSQKDMISHLGHSKSNGRELYKNMEIEAVDTSMVAPYQVPIQTIEDMTGLKFGSLKEVDAYALYEEQKKLDTLAKSAEGEFSAYSIAGAGKGSQASKAAELMKEPPSRQIKSLEDIII